MGYKIKQLAAMGGNTYAVIAVDAVADFDTLPAYADGSVGYIKDDPNKLYQKLKGAWTLFDKTALPPGPHIELDGVNPYMLMLINVGFARRGEVDHLLASDLRMYHYMTELPTDPGTDVAGMMVYTWPNKKLYVSRQGCAQDMATLTVTEGAVTKAGNVTITLNGVAKTVAVEAEDTPALVADAIAATEFPGWYVGRGGGNTVAFAKIDAGAVSAPTFADTGVTGCEAAFERTQEGVTAIWGEVDLEADTFTYLIRAALPTTEAGNFEGMIIYNTTDHTLQVCTTPGEQELDTLTVTKGAETQLGNITITLNAKDVVVAVLKDDTAAEVAAKIKEAVDAVVEAGTIDLWAVTCVDATLTFLKGAIGTASAPTAEDTGGTGCTFSAFARTNQGVDAVWAALINAS
jgi:hypothetical protein